MTRCRQYRERIQDLLDLRRDPARDPEISRHAALCPACARFLREVASLATLAAVTSAAEAPAGGAESVLRRVRSETVGRALPRASRPAMGWRPAVAWAASAAVVLFLGMQLGLRLQLHSGTAPTAASAPAVAKNPVESDGTAVASNPSLPAPGEESGSPTRPVVVVDSNGDAPAVTAPPRAATMPRSRSRVHRPSPPSAGSIAPEDALSPGTTAPTPDPRDHSTMPPSDTDAPVIVISPGQGL